MSRNISRRNFIASSSKISLLFPLLTKNLKAQVFGGLYEFYNDETTRVKIFRLVKGPSKNTTIYQTHPMWSPDMKAYYFLSDISTGEMQLHKLEIATGKIICLLENHIQAFSLCWNSENIYYIEDKEVIKRAPNGSITKIAMLPNDVEANSGGIAITPDEQWLYSGFQNKNGKWSLKRLYLKEPNWEECCEVDFQIGHVQTNPWDNSKVMFCWETGGDSPQRTWYWNATTKKHQPFFLERDELWVTHEVWWGKDSALFTVWPYDEKHKSLPHGVCYTTIEKGAKSEMDVLSLYPAWHTHGSHDLKWVLGDDFDRNIWLINPTRKEKRLLVRGKTGKNIKVHPHASFTPDGKGIVFNTSAFGMEEIHLVILPENFESLPQI
ncbi:MAG: oligogalacturonate lyase family protein [Candidatus Hydrogenedentes bacterium]|nr:oligogalacturonate lyase family protein [Candidatus Hydrogenedentota bacterium]